MWTCFYHTVVRHAITQTDCVHSFVYMWSPLCLVWCVLQVRKNRNECQLYVVQWRRGGNSCVWERERERERERDVVFATGWRVLSRWKRSAGPADSESGGSSSFWCSAGSCQRWWCWCCPRNASTFASASQCMLSSQCVSFSKTLKQSVTTLSIRINNRTAVWLSIDVMSTIWLVKSGSWCPSCMFV